MGPPDNQTFYDLLDNRKKSTLNAIGERANSGGQEPCETAVVSSVIEILESWLLDDEQKQSLKTSIWDIFFLYAGAILLVGSKPDCGN